MPHGIFHITGNYYEIEIEIGMFVLIAFEVTIIILLNYFAVYIYFLYYNVLCVV